MLQANPMKGSLALYIHWPFCISKCPYCDFNSHVSKTPVAEARWRSALLTELKYFAQEPVTNRPLGSIFFGGGTPSNMDPKTTAVLIEEAKLQWPKTDCLEISLEANPTSIDSSKLKDFAAAGINRLSLGVQSFSDQSLKFLGREHSAKEARIAIELASKNFKRYSFDLIYGLPEQTSNMWKHELREAIYLAKDHLSLYQLGVEPGTQFYANGVCEASPETAMNLYKLTNELTAQAGLNHYEISNYAQPGEECRHNVSIWRGIDYVGVGPGAHGRISLNKNTDAIYQVYNPDRWLKKVESKGHATAKRQCLTQNERAEEIIMTGLRLSEGIELCEYGEFINKQALIQLEDSGFLVKQNGFLQTTERGKLCLNSVIGELLSA